MPDAPFNFELTKAIEDHKAGLALLTQQQKLSIDLAMVVVRSMVLVNGGATIAILALLGDTWSRDNDAARRLSAAMQDALFWFGAGLFSILATAFLVHLSLTAATHVISHQLLGRRETAWAKRHEWIRRAALAVGGLSFIAFAIGVIEATSGFR